MQYKGTDFRGSAILLLCVEGRDELTIDIGIAACVCSLRYMSRLWEGPCAMDHAYISVDNVSCDHSVRLLKLATRYFSWELMVQLQVWNALWNAKHQAKKPIHVYSTERVLGSSSSLDPEPLPVAGSELLTTHPHQLSDYHFPLKASHACCRVLYLNEAHHPG